MKERLATLNIQSPVDTLRSRLTGYIKDQTQPASARASHGDPATRPNTLADFMSSSPSRREQPNIVVQYLTQPTPGQTVVQEAEQITKDAAPVRFDLRSQQARIEALRVQAITNPTEVRKLANDGHVFARKVVKEYEAKHTAEKQRIQDRQELLNAAISGYTANKLYQLGVVRLDNPTEELILKYHTDRNNELPLNVRTIRDIGHQLYDLGATEDNAMVVIELLQDQPNRILVTKRQLDSGATLQQVRTNLLQQLSDPR